MATVQAAQARTVRAVTTWSPPPPSGLMYTRPWRSSPLAGPVFSSLPPIISESSEDEQDLAAHQSVRELEQSRSPSSLSIVSQASASVSGYGSRNASGSLVLLEGEASTSSISLPPSTSGHGTSSSQGHGNSRTHRKNTARLSKSWGRRVPSAEPDAPPKTSITPPPRAAHPRPASHPGHTVVPTPTYSRPSPIHSDANTAKQPPSTSRDPTSNWMSSTPFGPATTPKFSRLAMASPAVVMPLSAREYRKRKVKEAVGKGKEKDSLAPSHHVPLIDNAMSAFQSPDGDSLAKVSSPSLEDIHQPRSPPSSSGDHNSDRHSPPQPQVDHPPPKPFPHASLPPQPQPHPSHTRPRSRPITPPRSSPLVAHPPPISPKSSAGTFFSLTSILDDDTLPSFPSHDQGADAPDSVSSPADDPNAANAVPPARPRPRPHRRKSYPDRLSNGARLSLLEAMDRLSQESAALHRFSQTDGANRLSIASQASGHTLFYDVVDLDGEVWNENGGGQHTSASHTQSLEDLSSTLARTGIEVVRPHGEGDLRGTLDAERKGNRNVRVVRISDTVEVSPPPVHRRRKLTKSPPGSGRGPVQGTMAREQKQTRDRRTSLLPWKSKVSGDNKGGIASADEKSGEDGPSSTPIKSIIRTNETTAPMPVPPSFTPTINGSPYVEGNSRPKSNSTPTKKPPSHMPTPTAPLAPSVSSPSMPPRKVGRYTFSFLTSSKREKSKTLPASAGLDQNTKIKTKAIIKGIESGRNNTSTSIHTITRGSEATLTPGSPVLYDLTILASPNGLPGVGRGTSAVATVPMLRRLNAQEEEMQNAGALSRSEWVGKGTSTPSLITNGSTATISSTPHTPSFVRVSGNGDGGEPFVSRPSGLKGSLTDTSEEDSEGVQGGGRTSRMCLHRKQDQSPLARVGAAVETSEVDERVHLRASSSPGLLSPHLASRPGTSSSTLTTATETSGSYASFSTVPASTMSSASTSRSTSPSPAMGEKQEQERVVLTPQGEHGDGDSNAHACVVCGHVVSRPTSPISLTHDLERAPMHPMFTVPLLTMPASAESHSRPMHNMRLVGQDGYGMGRRGERHLHLSVPVPAAVGVGVKNDHMQGPVMTTRTAMTTDQTGSSPKVRKRPRPQTAPAGTGDIALKFIEETKARNVGVGVGGDRTMKPKGGSGESRFKTVLKGLLRWNG